MTNKRKDVLLRAAYDLLRRAEEYPVTVDPMEILVHYDGADCDGSCLMTDIATELGLDDSTDPLPLDCSPVE